MSDLIGVVIRQEWEHEIPLDIFVVIVRSETILVLPFEFVHTDTKWSITNFILIHLTLVPVPLSLFQEAIVGVVHPFVFLEEAAASEFLYFGWIWFHKVDIILLFVSGILENLVGTQMIWQFT